MAAGRGLGITLLYLLRSLRRGAPARDPWRSLGVEWRAASPPPKHNFDVPPEIRDQPHQYGRDAEWRRGEGAA